MRYKLILLYGIACTLVVQIATASEPISYDYIDKIWDASFITETSDLVRIKTYRDKDISERSVQDNLDRIKNIFLQWSEQFNHSLKHVKIRAFEWKKTVDGKEYRLFGLRLGNGAHKIAMITHVDTVAPGGNDWHPFEPRIEQHDYLGEEGIDFLVGRGAIDNKGPAVSAFIVLRALAIKNDSAAGLGNTTVELIFDTSEETDMATPHYLKSDGIIKPESGIVFDAMWCVRAEKGIERPIFYIDRKKHEQRGLWIESINTSPGPVNQIPDRAEAIIRSNDSSELRNFYRKITGWYEDYDFDDEDLQYRAARMDKPILSGNSVKLVTHVEGAQHGSAPQQNRLHGANPLVSLANFLAHLVENGTLENNAAGKMALFIKWAWGTKVLGEQHPDLLEAHDSVFVKGNGTTYALTRLDTLTDQIRLKVDIRYAIRHHQHNWDGKTEGLLDGESRFKEIFDNLTRKFNQQNGDYMARFVTSTEFAPDIRLPDNPYFSRIAKVYQSVTGKPCNYLAIGGGTDAKGHPELLAVGALFPPTIGPPINFHGRNEGAPLKQLRISTHILYGIMAGEIKQFR